METGIVLAKPYICRRHNSFRVFDRLYRQSLAWLGGVGLFQSAVQPVRTDMLAILAVVGIAIGGRNRAGRLDSLRGLLAYPKNLSSVQRRDERAATVQIILKVKENKDMALYRIKPTTPPYRRISSL